jgi:hypothetical protein
MLLLGLTVTLTGRGESDASQRPGRNVMLGRIVDFCVVVHGL